MSTTSALYEAEARGRIPVTGRSIEKILALHRLPLEIFEGATVYDLGCGRSNLAFDLEQRGVRAEVVGFDQKVEDTGADAVEASLECLPVDDESADIVLATYSMPMWALSVESIERFYSECRRVPKIGGLLSIYPIAASISLATETYPEIRRVTAKAGASSIRESASWQSLSHDVETLTVRKLASDTQDVKDAPCQN